MAALIPGPKPFVQIACICEKVLVEPDNVPTLIRVVDTYFLDLLENAPPGIQVGLPLTAFVSLKSGDVVGEFEVGLQLTAPDSEERPIRMWPVEFRGAENGVNMKVAFTLANPKLGLYWFDVLWGEEVLTRIPFRLKAKPTEPKNDVVAPSEIVTN
jgi:hypothetical protein